MNQKRKKQGKKGSRTRKLTASEKAWLQRSRKNPAFIPSPDRNDISGSGITRAVTLQEAKEARSDHENRNRDRLAALNEQEWGRPG